MSIDSVTGRARLREFRDSLAPDLYLPQDFIPWQEVQTELARLSRAVMIVQSLTDLPRITKRSLAEALREDDGVLTVLQRLLAAPGGAGFADGRELPEHQPTTEKDRRGVASLLAELGIANLLSSGTRVEDLLRVALVGSDARRRGYRRSATIQRLVWNAVTRAIDETADRLGAAISFTRLAQDVPGLRAVQRRWIIAADDVPIVAVVPVIQTSTGGRQQRDLSLTYPSLQAELDQIPLSLILIADGRGIAETPSRVLHLLFESVAACMSVKQAESGLLADAIESAAIARGVRSSASSAVSSLIESRLREEPRVTVKDLPVDREQASLALATYAAGHRELALELSAGGDLLAWQRPQQVAAARRLSAQFGVDDALETLSAILDSAQSRPVSVEDDADDHLAARILVMPADAILPNELLAVAAPEPPTNALLRSIARTALHHTPDAKVALLVVPAEPQSSFGDLRKLQSVLATSVVQLQPRHLIDMAEAARPARQSLIELVLRQADLTKVSPYVLSSATPQRIFFGREEEEAILLNTLATNSVAILGGRRIGKTSLLRHVHARLEEADFAAFYGDCQTVRNWADFGSLARRKWGVRTPSTFRPQHLFGLVEQLSARGRQLVFLLDEVDQLLDWDQQHTDEEVPEAFFRACRTLSQEGQAQFVFTGERTIANKLWDAQSPHWNFCRPLPLQQLSRSAAVDLLVQPMESLGIQITSRESFDESLWLFTSGHPQLVQTLGDRLVRLLNERRADERAVLGPADLESVADAYEYREHYIETYWGQATSTERLLTTLILADSTSVIAIHSMARSLGVDIAENHLTQGLRMLDLYGVLRQSSNGYTIRASWLDEALAAYGGRDAAIERYVREVGG